MRCASVPCSRGRGSSVPYFQRAYSCRRRQWTTLLDDVLEYDQILHPQRESDAEVRKRLQRLTAWSTTVPYQFNPLLLRLHADYRRGSMSAEQITSVFRSIESMFVRRLFTAAPVRDDNHVLIELYAAASTQSDRAEAFAQALARPQIGWPDDADFVEGIVRYPLYFASHPDQRKLVFEALE